MMERLTPSNLDKVCYDTWELCGLDNVCKRDCRKPVPCKIPDIIRQLAAYEDTDLTPEEIPQWISITDHMPEMCGMPVLLVGINGFGQTRTFEGFTGYCKRGTLLFHSNCKDIDIDQCDITHWMPLPQPPKEEK